jgi:hypothetical protein
MLCQRRVNSCSITSAAGLTEEAAVAQPSILTIMVCCTGLEISRQHLKPAHVARQHARGNTYNHLLLKKWRLLLLLPAMVPAIISLLLYLAGEHW